MPHSTTIVPGLYTVENEQCPHDRCLAVNDMRPNRTTAALVAALALLSVVAVYVALRDSFQRPDGETSRDLIDQTMDRYSRIPPELRLYREMPPPIDPQLAKLRGIALDARGALYVAGDKHVVAFTTDGEPALRLTVGVAVNCIAVTVDGDILLGADDHVRTIGGDGARKATWAGFGRHAIITSLAVGTDAVFVADAGNRCVWKCDFDGAILNVFGRDREHAGGGSFLVPSPFFDVGLSPRGDLWVANPGRLRVELLASVDGRLLSSWGRPSFALDGFCGCCNPTHIAITPEGRIVTSEKGLPRVKIYEPSGRLTGVIAGPADFAGNVKGLDIAVAADGRVFVLDPGAGTVRVFVRRDPEPSQADVLQR